MYPAITNEIEIKVERMFMEGLSPAEIAKQLGLHRATVSRWKSKRKERLDRVLSERQAVVFDYLVRNSIEDLETLGKLIQQFKVMDELDGEKIEPSLVLTDAFGKRTQIVRNLARFFGIESTIKVQHIQNNLQLNDNRKQVSMNGLVQVIIEPNGGQFDAGFGQVRMDSPSADEISSATGE